MTGGRDIGPGGVGSMPKVLDSGAWAKTLSASLFDCEVEIAHPDTFQATVRSRAFADLEFVEVASSGHSAYRDHDRVKSSGQGGYLAVLQLAGEIRVRQDGRSEAVEPGQLCFIDSARPVAVETSDNYRAVGVKVPDRLLHYPREDLANLTARALLANEGVASTVCAMLLTLNDQIDAIETSDQYRMVRGVMTLVETMLSSVAPPLRGVQSSREADVEQIKEYLEAHLGDPDLGPQAVADAHFISVRQLHYLFKATGVSMSTWVRDRRLDRCQADLTDPRSSHLSISAIARKWGLNSSSHFGQIFKGATGLSPKEFRDLHSGRESGARIVSASGRIGR